MLRQTLNWHQVTELHGNPKRDYMIYTRRGAGNSKCIEYQIHLMLLRLIKAPRKVTVV